MARQAKASIFDRKLEELRRQSELVENDLRSLSKSMRRLEEGGTLPPLKSQRPDSYSPRPVPAREPAPAPAPRDEPDDAETLDRTFSTASSAARELSEDTAPGVASSAEPAPLIVDTRRRLPPQGQRFGKYLATGSFGGGRPLADERRILRNKAIFMLVVAVLAAIIVLRLVF